MTISSNPSAPLFVVVGSTGQQGSAVIKAIEASSIAYRVRGLTRDTTKSAAKALEARGVEAVSADATNVEELKAAFKGATYVFAMTTPNEEEVARGKNQVIAAKDAGVKVLVWAGLPSFFAQTDGKYTCFAFDQKAEVTAFARTIATPSFRVIDVQPAGYVSNLWGRSAPRKGPDGTWMMALPSSVDSVSPIIDLDEDYGEYVLGAIERGRLDTVYASPEYISRAKQAAILTKVLGKPFKAVVVPAEVIRAAAEPMMLKLNAAKGKEWAQGLADMYLAVELVGYWAGADLAESNKILRRPARTFEESIVANKAKFDTVIQ